ncbi:TauD/TfdA family dioxygenase [Moorena sp. SIO4G3]|uniref:TauD/TfdA family dioxygenase n=1 Tax=Moorena sp. SIO4G3 TaxID=2607821 RepID=UPI00142AE4CA|nr:TauD/TfdA family dioxygenase [Moorena sp. SIO4G3]NEO81160.1 taurine catabolism dioxygenase TauD [Moorena sp. SIO4G3]
MSIKKLIECDDFVIIYGKKFHYVWLYNNSCVWKSNPLSKGFQLHIKEGSVIPKIPKPLSIKIDEANDEEQLIIEWNEEADQKSIFSISWLLSNAYDPEPELLHDQKVLWDKVWLDEHPQISYDFRAERDLWMNQLSQLGFTLLRNIDFQNLETFAQSIGPLTLYANYDPIMTIKYIPTSVSATDSNNFLRLHTDWSFMESSLLVTIQYCLENSVVGGESILVDGFRVCNDFCQDYPEYGKILSEFPVEFWHFTEPEFEYLFSQKKTIIKQNHKGEVTEICFSDKDCKILVNFNQTEQFYKAYATLSKYIHNPKYYYQYKMQPGDCFLMQNWRIIHGRQSFQPNSGYRELKTLYIDWQYFMASKRFKQHKNLYTPEHWV